MIINETTVGELAKQSNVETASYKGDIEKALDRVLRDALYEHKRKSTKEYPALLLEGTQGVGKSARVTDWAEENNINLVELDAKVMEPTDLGGAIAPDMQTRTVMRFANEELYEQLDRPRSVLFLDEYNRAGSDIRGTLLGLINNHFVPDPREHNRKRFFPNLLFVVAAINPYNANFDTRPLDLAEISRFAKVSAIADKQAALKHLKKVLTEDAEDEDDPEVIMQIQGRLGIATALLSDPNFNFDSEEELSLAFENQSPVLDPRSLAKCLQLSDGTKDDFLEVWDMKCNPNKKPTVERILRNYVDVKDKSNEVLGRGTDSTVFAKPETDWDKLVKSGMLNA